MTLLDRCIRGWYRDRLGKGLLGIAETTLILGAMIMGVIAMATMASASPVRRSSTTAVPFTLMVQEGDPAPAAIGGTYAKIVSSSIDDSDAITFSADLVGASVGSAIMTEAGGQTQVLVRAGDPAPGGGAYQRFLEVDRSYARFGTPPTAAMTNPFAFLIFHATLEGGSGQDGIFVMAPDGSIQALGVAGGLSPRGFHYQSFSQPSIVALSSNLGPSYYAVFLAQMGEGNLSVVSWKSVSPPPVELTTGDTIAEDTITGLTITRAGDLVVGLVMNLTTPSGGAFTRVAILVGGSTPYGENQKTGGKIVGVGTIKHILGPPGIYFQVPVMPIVLKGGQAAIANMELGAFVSEKQGNRAPGLPGFKLKSFGPPVGNDQSQWPPQQPQPAVGFASLVGLSRGAQGILVWFLDMSAAVQRGVVLLPAGTGGDGQPLTPQGITLVKLSNTGNLLFNGTVGPTGSEHLALFEMRGLFNPPE